jgi:tetraacyldisaccharide 4'-kinase
VHALHEHWRRRTWVSALLLPLAALFALVCGLRRLAYRRGWLASRRLAVPVIVVGNISAGGTGKTPLVLWLVQRLRERGFKPGIVSRGYGGTGECREVRPDADPSQAGDEPVLLAARSRCPVWIGTRRGVAAARLLAAHPECDVLVSDDGLQHYALARNVEIAVIDGQTGLGNGRLLPAGPLREPPSRLGRCDAVVVNGAEGQPPPGWFEMHLEGDTLYNLRDPALRRSASALRGRHVHAIAGIGNPERFFSHLRRLGLSITAHAFPDHHRFSPADLDLPDADAVVMTEKDAIKCRAFARDNWWALPVEARVDPLLLETVLEKVSRRGSQAA